MFLLFRQFIARKKQWFVTVPHNDSAESIIYFCKSIVGHTSYITSSISHPEYYGDVIYKLRKILEHLHFENLFYKRIKSFTKQDYDPVILQCTSRLVVDPSTVDSRAFLFGCAVTNSV